MKTHKSLLLTTVAIALLPLGMIPSAIAQDSTPVLSQHDQLKIAVQKICPVMGKPLGSMGTPVKMKIGEEELFLCCKACAKGPVSREHWATIHANFRKAQGQCPVMEKDLGVGTKWTVVNGQIFYVCCPPCIEKIKADPTTYLAKLHQLYAANTADLQGHDAIKMAVQKICPVMGEPLGSMRIPIKVKIGEEELFLCCEACRKGKIDRTHWATIHANFAKAQGTCPVMRKPLPANPKWTVVNGQIIYVCCPPCVEKIKANPVSFTTNLDKVYRTSLNGTPTLR